MPPLFLMTYAFTAIADTTTVSVAMPMNSSFKAVFFFI